MTNNILNTIYSAERIALPKGENGEIFRQNFRSFTNIDIPEPLPRKYSAKAGGKQFFWLRAMDIAMATDRGLVDVGVTGTDGRLEYERDESLKTQTLGSEICRLSILTLPNKVDKFKEFMGVERRFLVPLVWLPTSRPRTLEKISQGRDFPFRACCLPIGGSVEAYAELTGAAAVADLVDSGRTARANGLVEAFKVGGIYTEVLTQKGEEE